MFYVAGSAFSGCQSRKWTTMKHSFSCKIQGLLHSLKNPVIFTSFCLFLLKRLSWNKGPSITPKEERQR